MLINRNIESKDPGHSQLVRKQCRVGRNDSASCRVSRSDDNIDIYSMNPIAREICFHHPCKPNKDEKSIRRYGEKLVGDDVGHTIRSAEQ